MFEAKWAPYRVTSQNVEGLRFVEPGSDRNTLLSLQASAKLRCATLLRDEQQRHGRECLREQRMRDSFRQDNHPLDWPTEH